jgi:hypothetical protein
MSKKSKPQIVPLFLENPDLIVKAVKVLREAARDPSASAKLRKKAQRALEDGGMDEDSVADKDLERIVKEHARRTLAELKGE